jgi:hypothetical protein
MVDIILLQDAENVGAKLSLLARNLVYIFPMKQDITFFLVEIVLGTANVGAKLIQPA